MARHRIASIDDVPYSSSKAFEVAGQSVLVCHTASGVFAIENMCSHARAVLEGGRVKGVYIFCPLHGVRFDLRNGEPSGTLTKKPITVYPSVVEDGAVYADLPDV